MLDAPESGRAQTEGKSAAFKRRAAVTEMPLRRDSPYVDDYSDGYDSDPEFAPRGRRAAVRLSFSGRLLPKTLWGRIAAGSGFLLLAGAAIATAIEVRGFLLHDEHFVIPTSESIQIAGNSHLTRPQLLSVFGEDVDRNIFTIPLDVRRAQLESLPWVAHATVMRLLPNRVRVAIVERTPVAFVRQGTQIGLVDANGVLFDLPGSELAGAAEHYSFPVLSGISAEDPLSTRGARMRIYLGFMAALDATGEGISHRLSEVDLSNPEDVKAIIPDTGASGADILVHFGEEKFLERYHQYQEHLAEWRTQYPRLASVDMRYEQQVVLEMQAGTPPATSAASAAPAPSAAGGDANAVKAKQYSPKVVAAPVGHAARPKARPVAQKKPNRKAGVVHAKAMTRTPTQGAPQ